jgi:hypothetical protein
MELWSAGLIVQSTVLVVSDHVDVAIDQVEEICPYGI